ncbi:hypothetical protein [Dermatobacter hominis]|uniref:hypothetical protein n=1 Tax=Dermatobacter hominis TaxID=2884263 RepID=UPI001D11237C|nr:hypothetical protein [Dermatobacter hominis]UDY36274.1 hypothetical protein LH044_01775 [Dermatobacter hominis]
MTKTLVAGSISRNRSDSSAVTADRYSAGSLDHWTRQRERVLGGLLRLDRDPERAAELLREQLGGRALATIWLHEALEAVNR